MYQKISDGYITVDKQKIKEAEEEKRLSKEQQPMSYLMCPMCDNPNLETCSCEGGFLNYHCGRCQFNHTNHHHKTTVEGGSKLKTIDKNLIAKNIRK